MYNKISHSNFGFFLPYLPLFAFYKIMWLGGKMFENVLYIGLFIFKLIHLFALKSIYSDINIFMWTIFWLVNTSNRFLNILPCNSVNRIKLHFTFHCENINFYSFISTYLSWLMIYLCLISHFVPLKHILSLVLCSCVLLGPSSFVYFLLCILLV